MADNGKHYETIGYMEVVPMDYGRKQTTTTYSSQSKPGGQSSFNQTTSKISCIDNNTGIYARATNKEVITTRETFKERSTRRVGYKDEYKITNTYKVGDKSGYTEYQVEERFRNVSYGGSGGNNKGKNKGKNKYLK